MSEDLPPKTRPYVTPVRSGGKWKWRARVRVGSKVRVSPVRELEESAYNDACKLLETRTRAVSGQPTTIAEALALVIRNAEESGIEPDSVDGSYRNQANAIVRWLDPRLPIAAVTEERVCHLIRCALAAGRAPVTVSKHYLRVLSAALRAAGYGDEPVKTASQRMRMSLRAIDPIRNWFPPDELADLLRRVREYEGPRPIPTQGRSADIMELVAMTGIRTLELSRVRVGDVDLERGELHVRWAKDRRRPRVHPLPPRTVECACRLVEGRRASEPLIRGGVPALDHMYSAWKKRLELPKLNGRTLRRSFGSGLDLLGASLATVRDGLGHAPHSTVTSRYLRTSHEILRAAVIRLSDALDE